MCMAKRITSGLFLLLSCLATPRPGHAEGTEGGLGLNVDVEVASSYLFRGINLFATPADKVIQQHPRVSPSVTWQIFDTGLSIGYYGAFQLAGDDIAANNKAGAGTEQDLSLTYQRELSEAWTASCALVSYIYPAGEEAYAGADFPVWLDPYVGIGYQGPADVSFKASYMFGLQSGLADAQYLYLNPTVGKSLPVFGEVALALALGLGYKVFTKLDNADVDNRFDVLLSVSSVIPVWQNVYAKPALLLSWTDRKDRGFGDEMGLSFGANVGADF